MIPFLHFQALGGHLSQCLGAWDTIVVSGWVRKVVSRGYRIPFKALPRQSRVLVNPPTDGVAFNILVDEAQELLHKKAIIPVEHEPGEYISTYFAVPKARSPGKFRPILNLRRFNKSVKKYHFRMESLSRVRDWLKKDAFCVGIDFKDASFMLELTKDSGSFSDSVG